MPKPEGGLAGVAIALAGRINAVSSASVLADPGCSTITRRPPRFSRICAVVTSDRILALLRYRLTSPIPTAR